MKVLVAGHPAVTVVDSLAEMQQICSVYMDQGQTVLVTDADTDTFSLYRWDGSSGEEATGSRVVAGPGAFGRFVRQDGGRKNFVLVKSAADLPAVSGGVHQLADNTFYEINGTVVTTAPIQYGMASFVAGRDWRNDIVVYTGADAAFKAVNNEFHMRFLTVVASAGKALDLSANSTTEFLMTLCAFANCDTLGTISGYRVPTIVKVAFDTFTNGLTFTGTSEKVLIDGCPFRGAAASAAALDFDSSFVTADVDLVGNYFKNFGAGAVGVRWDAGASLSGFGIVRGNVVQSGVTFASGISPSSLLWQFVGNSGVRDSDIAVDYTMSDNATATVLTQNTWTKIAGTTVANLTERLQMTANNRAENVSPRPIRAKVSYAASVAGSVNGQVIETAMYTNTGAGGAMEIASAPIKTVLTGPAGSRADNMGGNSIVDLQPNEYVEVWVRCTSSSNNITVESLQVTALG